MTTTEVIDVKAALTAGLTELRLPRVRHCYEETARLAERETLSYERYLLQVVTRDGIRNFKTSLKSKGPTHGGPNKELIAEQRRIKRFSLRGISAVQQPKRHVPAQRHPGSSYRLNKG